MSAISESTDQIRSALSSMPLQSRVVGIVLTLIVVGTLGYMATGSRESGSELLFGGRSLSEQELDSVEMSFSSAGLNGWKREGRRIMIPTQSKSQYLAALQKATTLPISIRSSVQDAIDKTTMFESSSQRIARQMHAKQQDLGNKLNAFPEIRWASVQYDLGEREGLGRSRKQSASVVVCPEGAECLPISRIQMIREFIRGSYAGMAAKDVVVIDTNASSNYLASDPWHREKLEVEAQLEHEVRDLLRDYGDIRVATSVDLQLPDAVSHRISNDPPVSSGSVVTQVRGSRATKLSNSNVDDQAGLIPPLVGMKSTFMAANTIRNLRVSVGLPESYYSRVWRYGYMRQHPDAESVPSFNAEQLQQMRDQTRKNIQSAIMPAMYGIANNDATSLEVWDYPDVLNDERMPATYQAQAMTWLSSNWQQAGLVLIGLLGLCVAGFVMRVGSPDPVTAHQNDKSFPRSAHESFATDKRPAPFTVGLAGDQNSDLSIGDEDLLALVESHPAAAADVIRDWISKAA